MPTLLDEIQVLAKRWASSGKVIRLTEVAHHHRHFPIDAFVMGSTEPHHPTLLMVGGIHGLERIGTEVTLAIQQHLLGRFEWDQSLQRDLQHLRLVFVPAVNPVGLMALSRCNGNGVDLMRNAPIDSPTPTPWVGGQTFSKRLPWYRGHPPHTFERMEIELRAIYELIWSQCGQSTFTLVLDCHSGFGLQDQLWYPYAFTRDPHPRLQEFLALKKLLDESLPHHVYRFEPQSLHYCTHGDLWDYLSLRWNPGQIFLPLTLEMGSWSWIKKNPLQLLSLQGAFHPIQPHRHKRILRRHLPLYQYLMNATLSHENWLPTGPTAETHPKSP